MMKKLKRFIGTSILGGVVVILPIALFFLIFSWLFALITKLIEPLTDVLIHQLPLQEHFLLDIIAIVILLGLCFFIGVLVRTQFGKFIHNVIESHVLKRFPGYSIIKETISQIFSKKNEMRYTVALVNIFGTDTLMTAFITDTHEDGSFTVFAPTGPNPTTGFIFHVKAHQVHMLNVPPEDMMRSVIGCGAGSSKLIDAYLAKINPKQNTQ